MIEQMLIKTENDTVQFAKDFITKLRRSEKNATVVALHGDLGVGKTTFVRAVAHEIGVGGNITSPTFVIMKEYSHKDGKLIHIDAYRLESENDLSALAWSEILSDKKNLIFIEWPERILTALPKDACHLYFKHIAEESRELTVEC